MKSAVNDVRMLKLAEMYEMAYERFVYEVATRIVDDPDVRAVLLALADPTKGHAHQIVKELERLNAELGPDDRADVVRAALLDVRDVEAAAREFYQRHADDVHDPRVARLFRELAREEAEHVRLAEVALTLAGRQAGHPVGLPRVAARRFRLFEDPNALPLREGATDFGDHAVAASRSGGGG